MILNFCAVQKAVEMFVKIVCGCAIVSYHREKRVKRRVKCVLIMIINRRFTSSRRFSANLRRVLLMLINCGTHVTGDVRNIPTLTECRVQRILRSGQCEAKRSSD